MKTKLTTLALITVTALSLAPKPAAASDKGLAILGGFIGGMIVASAIDDNCHDAYDRPGTTILVDRRNDFAAPCDDYRGRRVDCDDSGYWKVVTVRVWVPGYWIVERRHHGYGYRRYIEGHTEFRTERVWVSTDRDDCDDACDRDNRYGYDRR
jgi:hypothetical protein